MIKNESRGDKIFWLLQIMFSFIITRGLYEYKEIVLYPSLYEPATYALIGVLIVTMWSWIDFTQMSYNTFYERYDIHDMIRFLFDFIIVVVYAFILFSIDIIIVDPNKQIYQFLLSFPLIFLLYCFSGLFRRIKYGRQASRILLLFVYFIIFSLFYLIYGRVFCLIGGKTYNIITIILFISTYITFRIIRRLIKKSQDKPRLGVDIDGVIANQIVNLLPYIKEKYGVDCAYDDIDEWRKSIGNTTIDKIIVAKQREKSYILSIPLIEGAKKSIIELHRKFRIVLLTAREVETNKNTIKWLSRNRIHYDEYFNFKEGKKSDIKVRVIIDDYHGNIFEYLETNVDSFGILFKQPWNKSHDDLRKYIIGKRCFVAQNWKEVENIIDDLELNA